VQLSGRGVRKKKPLWLAAGRRCSTSFLTFVEPFPPNDAAINPHGVLSARGAEPDDVRRPILFRKPLFGQQKALLKF
jgi:hypothetical protein